MCLETLEACEGGGVFGHGVGLITGLEFEPRSDPQEVEDTQASLEPRHPSGGHRVIGADPIIAKDLGRGGADKEPSPVVEPFGDGVGVVGDHLEVLRRQYVADSDGLADVRGDDRETVIEGSLGHDPGREFGELPVKLGIDGVGQGG